MTSTPPPDATKTVPEPGFAAWLRATPRWQKITVGIALVTVVVAGAISLTTTGSLGGSAPPGTGGGSMGGLSTGFAPQGGSASAAGGVAPAAEEPASRGVFRLGFSFLAGFCIGAFVRATLKVAAIAFGFWLLATMALSYYGLLTVDLDAIGSLWDRFAAAVGREADSFRTFITGSLPSAGLAAGGLAMGLKRR